MVKTGSSRSTKFSAKHDAKVIVLRLKALSEHMKSFFQNPSQQFAIVDIQLGFLKSLLNLKYGQYGDLSDTIKSYLWDYETLTEADIDALHQKLLAKGYSEDEWNLIWISLEDMFRLITTRYERCHYPTNKAFFETEFQINEDSEALEA